MLFRSEKPALSGDAKVKNLASRIDQETGRTSVAVASAPRTPLHATPRRSVRGKAWRWRLSAAALLLCLCQSVRAGGEEPSEPLHDGLVVGISDQPPFCMRDEHGAWCGITFDLWKHIAGKLNLAYTLAESDLAGMVKGLDDRTYDLDRKSTRLNSSH